MFLIFKNIKRRQEKLQIKRFEFRSNAMAQFYNIHCFRLFWSLKCVIYTRYVQKFVQIIIRKGHPFCILHSIHFLYNKISIIKLYYNKKMRKLNAIYKTYLLNKIILHIKEPVILVILIKARLHGTWITKKKSHVRR